MQLLISAHTESSSPLPVPAAGSITTSPFSPRLSANLTCTLFLTKLKTQLFLGVAARRGDAQQLWVGCPAFPLPSSSRRGGSNLLHSGCGAAHRCGATGDVSETGWGIPTGWACFTGRLVMLLAAENNGIRFLYCIRGFILKQTPYYKELAR